ncbi:unnamed protein product [Chrysoparadoxa australica]
MKIPTSFNLGTKHLCKPLTALVLHHGIIKHAGCMHHTTDRRQASQANTQLPDLLHIRHVTDHFLNNAAMHTLQLQPHICNIFFHQPSPREQDNVPSSLPGHLTSHHKTKRSKPSTHQVGC